MEIIPGHYFIMQCFSVTDNLELGVFTYRFSVDGLPVAFKNYFSKRCDMITQQDTSMT